MECCFCQFGGGRLRIRTISGMGRTRDRKQFKCDTCHLIDGECKGHEMVLISHNTSCHTELTIDGEREFLWDNDTWYAFLELLKERAARR